MAEGDRSSVDPEIKAARLLLKRSGLNPPVPVLDLLMGYAEIERATIPALIDALIVRQSRSAKPRIILNAVQLNRNRERFTMAHELGHVILPWQTGTVFCHTDLAVAMNNSLYSRIEEEANRFAGELLVPMEWARSRLANFPGDLAERCVTLASLAEVSPMVAAFSVSRILPKAAIFITQDHTTLVSRFGTVFGDWRSTALSDSLRAEYEALGADHSSTTFGPYSIHCFEFASPLILKRTAQSSTEIIGAIVRETAESSRDRDHLLAAVNGIVGSANTRTAASTARDFLLALRARFTGRPKLAPIVAHPRFAEFLAAKASELSQRRKNAQSR